METILIHWDQPRPWTINYESKADKEKGREVSVAVHLVPGVQTVQLDEWKKIKEHPRVKQALEDKTLRVEEAVQKAGEDPKPLADMPKTLKGMAETKAVPFITGIMDEELLKKWQTSETRDRVKKAIKEQIAKLKAAIKKRED